MLRFIATSVLNLLGNALGLLAAVWLLEGFTLTVTGFLWAVVFFTIAEIILAPFVLSMAIKYVPALRGGIAIVTAFVVLLLMNLFVSGAHISGLSTWILAPLIIWLVTVLAAVVLPLFLFKKTLEAVKNNKEK